MTYYDVLEISEKASIEVIKMAYKALAKKYHPDTFTGSIKDANIHMVEINKAYTILSDPIKRADYDEFLKGVRSSTSFEKATSTHSSSNGFKNTNTIKETNSLDYQGWIVLATFVLIWVLIFIFFKTSP